MPKAHVSPLPPLRLTDVHITVVSSEEKTAKCSRWACAKAARTQPGEQALGRPSASSGQTGRDGQDFLERAEGWDNSIDFGPKQVTALPARRNRRRGTCRGLENRIYFRITGGSRTIMLNFTFSFFSVLSRSTRKSEVGKQNKTKQKEKTQ